MKKYSILLFVLLLAPSVANAQFTSSYTGAWSYTYNNPMSATASVMIQNAINKKMLEQAIANQQGKSARSTPASNSSAAASARTTNVAPAANYSVLLFKPAANSGVAKQIADTLSKDPQERAALLGL